MGRLSTHVLDTARGKPAAGVAIRLYRLDGEARRLVAQVVTNADGRSDAPLLAGADLRVGVYELVFAAGAYLRATGQAGEGQAGEGQAGDSQAAPLFLDEIPIRFGVADADGHYHVPLLISPFAYATYRGS